MTMTTLSSAVKKQGYSTPGILMTAGPRRLQSHSQNGPEAIEGDNGRNQGAVGKEKLQLLF